MTDVVPEGEEFGHDVPMDPTMEREESEQSEELEVSGTVVQLSSAVHLSQDSALSSSDKRTPGF